MTLKDVAKRAGVGLATASRVIRESGSVSVETAARVRAAIVDLQYRPSSIGRAMARRSLDALGIFVPDYADTDVRCILEAASREARVANRIMFVTSSRSDGPVGPEAIACRAGVARSRLRRHSGRCSKS